MSNLIHIHNNKIDILTRDKSIIDIQELESIIKEYSDNFRKSNTQESNLTLESLNSANTQIFLYSQLLLGSKESANNTLYFGELDFKNTNLLLRI